MVQPLWKTIWLFLKKLNGVNIQMSNSTSRYIPKRTENISMQKLVHDCLFISQKVEIIKMYIKG